MSRVLQLSSVLLLLALLAAPAFAMPHPAAHPAAGKTVKPAAPAKPATAPTEEEDAAPVMDDTGEATTVSDSQSNMPLVDKIGGKPFPWYGSLKKTEVNVRSGPGNKYPILWIYQRPGYPVQVLTRYDNYYKIRDVEGEEGWTYVGMISKRVTGLVGGTTPANLYHKADTTSRIVAKAAPGVVVEMENCDTGTTPVLCKVVAGGLKGWIVKSALEMVE